MFLSIDGLGTKKDTTKAFRYFQLSSHGGNTVDYVCSCQSRGALSVFDSRFPPGYLHPGRDACRGSGREERLQLCCGCKLSRTVGAVFFYNNFICQLFKNVAERGKWTWLFVEAEKMYSMGDLDSALLMYLLLAEMGMEVAQSNVAYILEQGTVR